MPTSSGPRLSWSHPQETSVFAVAPRIQNCDQKNCGILAITLSVVKIIWSSKAHFLNQITPTQKKNDQAIAVTCQWQTMKKIKMKGNETDNGKKVNANKIEIDNGEKNSKYQEKRNYWTI